jgi:hypothetical protein
VKCGIKLDGQSKTFIAMWYKLTFALAAVISAKQEIQLKVNTP